MLAVAVLCLPPAWRKPAGAAAPRAPTPSRIEEWRAMVAQAGEPHTMQQLRELARDGRGDAQVALGSALLDLRDSGLRDEGLGLAGDGRRGRSGRACQRHTALSVREARLALGAARWPGCGLSPRQATRPPTTSG
ncbi:MAG: hypothetical protein VB137_15880 [Burkholderia sp.]